MPKEVTGSVLGNAADVTIEQAVCEPLLNQARILFAEYQQSLGIDLSFQRFNDELASLPGKYAPPQGRILLASVAGALAGCIALRPFRDEQCEMKRLYVRPSFRGRNLGRILANAVIAEAHKIGYKHILLDTLPAMTAAQALYRSLGFCETIPYCYNPIEGSLYMKLDLSGSIHRGTA